MNRIAVAREMGSPLHHQVYLVLADGISTGRYEVGAPLPTEQQLTRMFSVSRILHDLVEAGLIAVDGRDVRILDVARLRGHGS